MTVYRAICLDDYSVTGKPDGDGAEVTFTLKRGNEYTVSAVKDGLRTVFSQYWLKAPDAIFGGVRPL